MSLQRQAVSDQIEGSVTRLDSVTLLTPLASAPGELLASGSLLLRYGLVCLEMPQLCIVPELVVLEYGEQLSGEEAWDFLLHHSNLHPRAEAHGYRDDGIEDQLRVSRLDLAQAPRVLVWRHYDAEDSRPCARPQALISNDPDALPERLRQYLPCHPTFIDWRNDRA